METKSLNETGIEIWLRLHVLKRDGFVPVLVQLHKMPFMNTFDGKTTLTTADHKWTIFIQESMVNIQDAVFSFQEVNCEGSC